MKYLLVLMVVLVAVWLWKKNRREDMRERAARGPARPAAVMPPEAMARCAHCGLHLPLKDAITGPDGVYCTPAHRQAAG